jgi:glycosyltransferase involved in cell wall biosynthesis
LKLSIITVTRTRPLQLINQAAFSLQQQTSLDFEWIVINDGGDYQTRISVANQIRNFPVIYREIEHSPTGFSLCHGRNLALKLANGKLVTYLDDDNSFKPNFVEQTIEFFFNHPHIKCSLPLQKRRREVWQNGKLIKIGKSFISPLPNTNIEQLITHQQLFDSNKFTHFHSLATQWNPSYRIYCDYEYFLQCLSLWGLDSFKINPLVLVDYIQTTLGVIGQSSYYDWAIELERIIENACNYSILQSHPEYIKSLQQLQQKFKTKQQSSSVPEAFKPN